MLQTPYYPSEAESVNSQQTIQDSVTYLCWSGFWKCTSRDQRKTSWCNLREFEVRFCKCNVELYRGFLQYWHWNPSSLALFLNTESTFSKRCSKSQTFKIWSNDRTGPSHQTKSNLEEALLSPDSRPLALKTMPLLMGPLCPFPGRERSYGLLLLTILPAKGALMAEPAGQTKSTPGCRRDPLKPRKLINSWKAITNTVTPRNTRHYCGILLY